NAQPLVGNTSPAPICDLAKASAILSPTPITSPVDFISGPKIVSTPGNIANGKTAYLTLKNDKMISMVQFNSANDLPAITLVVILAKDTPMHFDTKGTVRDARGFTSIT